MFGFYPIAHWSKPAHSSCHSAGEPYLSRRIPDFVGFLWHLHSWRERGKTSLPKNCTDVSAWLLLALGFEHTLPALAREASRERALGSSQSWRGASSFPLNLSSPWVAFAVSFVLVSKLISPEEANEGWGLVRFGRNHPGVPTRSQLSEAENKIFSLLGKPPEPFSECYGHYSPGQC